MAPELLDYFCDGLLTDVIYKLVWLALASGGNYGFLGIVLLPPRADVAAEIFSEDMDIFFDTRRSPS